MKKALSLILSAAIPLCSLPLGLTASAAETDAPVYETKQVETKPYQSEESIELNCIFRSGLPEIPFVNVEDYLSQLYNLEKGTQSVGSGVYKIENGGYELTLDAEKDVISFDFYEGFMGSNFKLALPFSAYSFIDEGNGMNFGDAVMGVEFDLAKYDLDVVEKDGSVYLPFCTLNDMFSNVGLIMSFKKDTLRMTTTPMGAKGSFPETRTKEYSKFIYDEFCFSSDYFHGKPTKAKINETIKKVGFDKALDTYDSITPHIKELLLSDSNDDYVTGLALLQYYLDDGGHTEIDYSLSDALKSCGFTDVVSEAKKLVGNDNKDVAAMIESENEMTDARNAMTVFGAEKLSALKSMEIVKDWNGAKLYKSGDTYFFEFLGFNNNAIEPFKEAMDYAAEHNAKYFIADTNGGGDTIVAAYMISLMSGGSVKYTEKCIPSGNLMKFGGRIDKNLDGKFDEKDDAVKYDFRCAVIANSGCYSCSSIYTGMAQDNGICVIGEQTSGGSCAVTARVLPNGTSYNISGYSMYVRENGEDPDNGTTPDVLLPSASEEYKGFYDIAAINKGISEFYGDPVPQTIGTYGDLDGDVEITANDALTILRQSVGLATFTSLQTAAADIDGDKNITANDALAVLRYSVGLAASENIGKAITA